MEQEAPWLTKDPRKFIAVEPILNSGQVEAGQVETGQVKTGTAVRRSANSLYLRDHIRTELPYALRENALGFQT